MKDCKHLVPYATIDGTGKTRWYCAACDVPIETKVNETPWAKLMDEVMNNPLVITRCECAAKNFESDRHSHWCPLYEQNNSVK